MHCEYETYVLQNRMLNLQFTGFGRPREHKLGGDILEQHAHGRMVGTAGDGVHAVREGAADCMKAAPSSDFSSAAPLPWR
jgi:hypothetical protein